MISTNTFVFDLETVPDIAGARKLYDLPADLSDQDVAEYLFTMRRQATGNDFLRHHLHRIVAISIVFKQSQGVKVWSLGDEASDEADLIERFFSGIDKYRPALVSWNGSGFDLPVLHYRALINGIKAESYWDMEGDCKWHNYISRYQFKHMDLMDILSGYQLKSAAPLDEISTLLGFPGKMGMDGSKVWQHYLAGNIKGIRDYCETDVLNTYLVYLQFEFMRGNLNQDALQRAKAELAAHLESADAEHFRDFMQAWQYD